MQSVCKNFAAVTTRNPLRLESRRVWRPFRGGRELDRLHGAVEPVDANMSEEWMFSTTRATLHASDNPDAGLSRLWGSGGKTLLADCIAADPAAMLGKRHADAFGADTGILVKLLDSRDRLALQVHPDRVAARRFFHSGFGKTESWHILAVREDSPVPPQLFLGFREGVTRQRWGECFAAQDVEAMFAMLHAFTPVAGETYLVPGGAPHAVGAGCLIVELQEATDITLRVETHLPSGVVLTEDECCLGIGVEAMLDCFHYEGVTEAQARRRYVMQERPVSAAAGWRTIGMVGAPETECFGMERLEIDAGAVLELEPGGLFSCLYVLSGEGMLSGGDVSEHITGNAQFFLPAECGVVRVVNSGTDVLNLLRFYGPASFKTLG